MKSHRLLALISACSLILGGCEPLATRPIQTTEITWAKLGTPARIVDERTVRVLVPDGHGGWTPGDGHLAGMIAIDEPTLLYYQRLDQAQRAAAAGTSR